ncbi:MAG: hypothetical protein B1H11_10495 [Desulfobacteraceae bacterium 4484_190.1]|nr:MAG: hypothetical protein B1H11_10495 [Desulfobacteraceae bacterium 4484_190.1]
MGRRKEGKIRRVYIVLAVIVVFAAFIVSFYAWHGNFAAKVDSGTDGQGQESVVGKKKPADVRLLIVGEWRRPDETVEFTSGAMMMIRGLDKEGRRRFTGFHYRVTKEGLITLWPVGIGTMGVLKRGRVRVSGDELHFQLRGELEEKVYKRVHR